MNILKKNHHLVLLFIIFACIFKYAELDCTKSSSLPIKTYIIDLDKPARQRFTESAKDFKDAITAYIKINKYKFINRYQLYNSIKYSWTKRQGFKIPEKIIRLVELFAADIDSYFPYPFNEELKGIAEATGVELGDVVISNLIYDLTAYLNFNF